MEELITAPLFNSSGETSGQCELPPNIFGRKMNKKVVIRALNYQLTNQRRGTASTLTRAEVSGGGKKPWPQKGTGNARQGTIRSPLWPGGGITFGPKPRLYNQELPKKERRMAIFSLLSEKVQGNSLYIFNPDGLEPKTKSFAKSLQAMKFMEKTLLIFGDKEQLLERIARNIPFVKTLLWQNLNVRDLLDYPNVLITQEALEKIKEVWG